MVAVFAREGLLRIDGHRSSRSGNQSKGDHNKSEDFSHAHISSKHRNLTTRRAEEM